MQLRDKSVGSVAAIAIVIATAFLYNRWLLDARTYFHVDDWQWLWRAEFFPWSDPFFSVFPSWAYNDRPVGAGFIKAVYDIVGLNHRAFQAVWLSLHVINCVLLYLTATRYISRAGSLTASVLAATWFSANQAAGWVAAIFDLLGATLCLTTVLLRQMSFRSGILRYDLAGALCYILAIRTKEFALGLVAVLFLMNVLVERQSVRVTIRQLWPYLFVFLVFAARYTQLLTTTLPPSGAPYHLELTLTGLAASIGFYASALFNDEAGVPPVAVAGLVVALGVGMLLAEGKAQRTAVWGVAAAGILLAPVLLLPAQVSALYLYAPHFFLALALGALVAKRVTSIALVAILAAGILIPPTWTATRQNVINFYYLKGQANRAMFNSVVQVLAPLPPSVSIFISGVEPVFNPFWMRPGNALKIAFKDFDLAVETERREAELAAKFCKAQGPRRFLRFEGTRATDVTAEVARRCDGASHG